VDLLGLKQPKRGTEYSSVCRAEVNNAHTFMAGLEITVHLARERFFFQAFCHLLTKSLVFF